MSWVKITEDIFLKCVRNVKGSNKSFKYLKLEDDSEIILTQSNQSPTESTSRSELHSFIKDCLLMKQGSENLEENITQIKNNLEQNIVDEEGVLNNESELQNKQLEKEIHEKYINLYSSFNSYCDLYHLTPLGLIVSVSHCLSVGNTREIVRAFLGYFQTACGFKGTNVIAIGSAASGKSFTLESALSMIPDEIVFYGVKSVAYFFRRFQGQDLTGKIFYIGDLGGLNDNANTIEFRDTLKALTTDGKVEKGIVDTENMTEMDMTIEGYPALSYTTALEETINDQEKSRSVILTPQPVDTGKLMVFDAINESNGIYKDDLNEINKVKESIKGLVHMFNPDDFDFFNPYMFCIEELLKDNDDFNRKVQEYNAILKLITLLDNPNKINHSIYFNEDYEPKETNIVLASKRDNINALNVFDSANLLPDEIRFANGLLKEYDSFESEFLVDDELFESQIINYLNDEYLDQAINSNDGYLNMESDTFKTYWFTIRTLRQAHRGKSWFKKSKNYISERVKKLVDEGILLVLGKDAKNHNHNVYVLNKGLGDSVEDNIPTFRSSDIKKASNLFARIFPSQLDEYHKFLENDDNTELGSIFELQKPLKPNLPFLEDEYVSL